MKGDSIQSDTNGIAQTTPQYFMARGPEAPRYDNSKMPSIFAHRSNSVCGMYEMNSNFELLDKNGNVITQDDFWDSTNSMFVDDPSGGIVFENTCIAYKTGSVFIRDDKNYLKATYSNFIEHYDSTLTSTYKHVRFDGVLDDSYKCLAIFEGDPNGSKPFWYSNGYLNGSGFDGRIEFDVEITNTVDGFKKVDEWQHNTIIMLFEDAIDLTQYIDNVTGEVTNYYALLGLNVGYMQGNVQFDKTTTYVSKHFKENNTLYPIYNDLINNVTNLAIGTQYSFIGVDQSFTCLEDDINLSINSALDLKEGDILNLSSQGLQSNRYINLVVKSVVDNGGTNVTINAVIESTNINSFNVAIEAATNKVVLQNEAKEDKLQVKHVLTQYDNEFYLTEIDYTANGSTFTVATGLDNILNAIQSLRNLGSYVGRYDNVADLPTTATPNDFATVTNGPNSGPSRYVWDGTTWIWDLDYQTSGFQPLQTQNLAMLGTLNGWTNLRDIVPEVQKVWKPSDTEMHCIIYSAIDWSSRIGVYDSVTGSSIRVTVTKDSPATNNSYTIVPTISGQTLPDEVGLSVEWL